MGAPTYGEKRQLWEKLVLVERRAAAELAYQAELAAAAEERRDARGETPTRVIPEPQRPSAAELEAHNMTHIPVKAWCPICIRAKAHGAQHRAFPAHEKY